ncbi:hypothetical protein [Streptomyces albidochromogenes]|uniref:hypothetical protein n=1 Tax=Streptomyces albidochromogenes TaxID=329524 RepID=UPI00110F8488|nr:hypothetical protein [Streptomyces albidochromogenes]
MNTRGRLRPASTEVLAAHQAVVPAQRVDLGIIEAIERQSRAGAAGAQLHPGRLIIGTFPADVGRPTGGWDGLGTSAQRQALS